MSKTHVKLWYKPDSFRSRNPGVNAVESEIQAERAFRRYENEKGRSQDVGRGIKRKFSAPFPQKPFLRSFAPSWPRYSFQPFVRQIVSESEMILLVDLHDHSKELEENYVDHLNVIRPIALFFFSFFIMDQSQISEERIFHRWRCNFIDGIFSSILRSRRRWWGWGGRRKRRGGGASSNSWLPENKKDFEVLLA